MQLNIFKGSQNTTWERAPKSELFSPGWLGLKSKNCVSKLSWDLFEKKNFQKVSYGARDGRWAHYFKCHLLYSSLGIPCMIKDKQILIEYSNIQASVYMNLISYEGRCYCFLLFISGWSNFNLKWMVYVRPIYSKNLKQGTNCIFLKATDVSYCVNEMVGVGREKECWENCLCPSFFTLTGFCVVSAACKVAVSAELSRSLWI